jgi:hypothetical protein
MTDANNSHAEAAIQHLIWALEEIGKVGNQKAGRHARIALRHMQDALSHQRASAK